MFAFLSRHRRRADRRLANDQGETLVELLITVVVMSIAVVAVVGGMATAIVMSDLHRKQATAGAAVRAFAEALQARVAAGGYQTCATTSSYPVPTPANAGYLPSGYSAAYVGQVAFWVPAQSRFAVPSSPASCVDVGVQRLTLQVTRDNETRVAEMLDVVLRKPCGADDSPCS